MPHRFRLLFLGAFVALLAPLMQAPMGASQADDGDVLRIAEPSDDVAHPTAEIEWWYANVQNPATEETFIAVLQTKPTPNTTTFWYDRAGNKSHITTPAAITASTEEVYVSGTAGTFSYDAATDTYHLIYHANGYRADLRYTNRRPGVTMSASYAGVTMWWSNPVATSVANGWIETPSGERIEVQDWRGYHDHNWGPLWGEFTPELAGWEWASMHNPDGGADVLGGLVTADGTWKGALVHVDEAGVTSFCRPDLVMSDWQTYKEFAYPAKVENACTDGASLDPVTWVVTEPHVVFCGQFTFTESLGYAAPGSVGLIEHFRTLAHGGVAVLDTETAC